LLIPGQGFCFVANFKVIHKHRLTYKPSMKSPFLIISALFFGFTGSNAQVTLDYNNGSAQFQKIIELDSASSADLYKSVNRWITLNFKDPEKVIQSKVENQSVRGNGFKAKGVRLSETPAEYVDLKYSFSVDIKEGRVRFVMHTMKALSKTGTISVESYIYKSDGTERGSVQGTNAKGSLTQLANSLISLLENSLLHKDVNKTEDW
jgi:hypothetical protein